jgi:hypothetical protein
MSPCHLFLFSQFLSSFFPPFPYGISIFLHIFHMVFFLFFIFELVFSFYMRQAFKYNIETHANSQKPLYRLQMHQNQTILHVYLAACSRMREVRWRGRFSIYNEFLFVYLFVRWSMLMLAWHTSEAHKSNVVCSLYVVCSPLFARLDDSDSPSARRSNLITVIVQAPSHCPVVRLRQLKPSCVKLPLKVTVRR